MADLTVSRNFFDRHRAKIAFAGPDDCWIWTAGKDGSGYGKAAFAGKARLVHRLAYIAVHGLNSADGLVVRHRCDVPACVNPAHLEIGTQGDNIRDMESRGRRGSLKGEANRASKATEALVREIRAAYVRGSSDLGQVALARRYGMTQAAIGKIINRRTWPHVGPD